MDQVKVKDLLVSSVTSPLQLWQCVRVLGFVRPWSVTHGCTKWIVLIMSSIHRNPHSSQNVSDECLLFNYKQTSSRQLTYIIGNLSRVIWKICKSNVVVDLHCSFIDTGQLCETHMLHWILYLVSLSIWSYTMLYLFNIDVHFYKVTMSIFCDVQTTRSLLEKMRYTINRYNIE